MEIETKKEHTGSCCGPKVALETLTPEKQPTPLFPTVQSEQVCCGPPADPPSGPNERPGYQIRSFVEDFIRTPVGPVPRVKTHLTVVDWLGCIRVRWGVRRNQYKVEPGLYCMGHPNAESPVLVSANYKLSFDMVRKESKLSTAWILVVDTRGINVWCAAGKGTFSTEEVVRQVKTSRLETLVSHRQLILPQLAATGVSALDVKKGCGFKVVWGPVRINDLKQFMDDDMTADTAMRRVTFTFWERLVLVPVELSFLPKYILWVMTTVFVLSGIGLSFFSFKAAWVRGGILFGALLSGVFSGAVLTPALLPWIPGRSFSLKGVFSGIPMGAAMVWFMWRQITGWEAAALVICTMAISSYLAMNFTGTTPFTSPSGVEKEMRKAIPIQLGALLATALLWVTASFV